MRTFGAPWGTGKIVPVPQVLCYSLEAKLPHHHHHHCILRGTSQASIIRLV